MAPDGQPIQRDKTVNDNYYLLTLAAIAKEIRQRGLPPECSVQIAAGLPLTSFGRDKPKFRDYLLRSKQPVNFRFEDVEYSITIEEVAIFPQGYAALMTEVGLLQDETVHAPYGSRRLDGRPYAHRQRHPCG